MNPLNPKSVGFRLKFVDYYSCACLPNNINRVPKYAVLEAACFYKTKQPRYDEVLLQLQGLSVMAAASSTAAATAAPRRRFRRLQTLDASMLEV